MRVYWCVVLCVLAWAGRGAAGPARRDVVDNSIDVDGAADITSDSLISTSTAAPEATVSSTELPPAAPAADTETTPADADPALTLPPLTTKEDVTTEKDEDDDDFGDDMSPSTNQGSNVFSLLSLVGQLFPGSSGSNTRVRRLFERFIYQNQGAIQSMEKYLTTNLIKPRRRQDKDNEIDIDEYYSDSDSEHDTSNDTSEEEGEKLEPEKPGGNQDEPAQEGPPGKEKSDEKSGESPGQETPEEENNAAEESVENGVSEMQNSEEKETDDSNSDYDDEPPGGGDGEGGGILGLIAGLSGGEDGQSDLSSLLAAVSGIVLNLSGDGVDVNGLIASGLGLFVGLLSEGMENPGSVVASYLNTALNTLSGGGSKNNGAFFGNFLSNLLKGISGAGGAGAARTTTQNPIVALKSGVARAFLQFATSIISSASSGST